MENSATVGPRVAAEDEDWAMRWNDERGVGCNIVHNLNPN
jgi:hypothetical protein